MPSVSHPTHKVILITGCSSGFGLLSAARLVKKGHIVYATMRDLAKQQGLQQAWHGFPSQGFIRYLDVTQPKSIATVVTEIIEKHQRLDVLINNAGYGLGGFFEDLTQEEIRAQFDVNFFGVQDMCRAVIPIMRQHKQGKIINISSIAGLCSSPSLSAYNASKWALEGFSESLYYELRPFGIQVVMIEPGSYPTKIFTDNARYAKNFDNPNSPYFHLSQHLRLWVAKGVAQSKKNPEDVARLIEKIITTANPRLRYIPDPLSRWRVVLGKLLPPSVSYAIFRKVVYGQVNPTV